MAQLDWELVFSYGQAVDGTNETTVSTNFLKLADNNPTFQVGTVNSDRGSTPQKTEIEVRVGTALTGGTSLQVQLWGSNDAAFSAETQIAASVAVPIASLRLGYIFNIPDCFPERSNFKFFRLKYVGVGTITAGAINAYVLHSRQSSIVAA